MTHGISIIIPTYKDAHLLKDAVQSVYNQNLKVPFEVIIINEGSAEDPGSVNVLSELLSDVRFPDLRVISHETRKGLSEARNTGLRAAKYAYIFPLDADDMLETDPKVLGNEGGFLDRALKELETNLDTVIVYGNIRTFDAWNYTVKKRRFDEKKELAQHTFGPHVLYRREEGLALGPKPYNPVMIYAEDWDFNLALLNSRVKQGKTAGVHYIEDPLIRYRIRKDKSNISSNQKLTIEQVLMEMIRRSPEIFAKYYSGRREEMVKQLMWDRAKVLTENAVKIFNQCVFNPSWAKENGAYSRVRHRGPTIPRRVLSFLNLTKAEPKAINSGHFLPEPP